MVYFTISGYSESAYDKEAVLVVNNSLEDWIAIQIESAIKAKKLNTLLQ